jgi:hypothetical protein
VSTVGSASATESVGDRTTTSTEVGGGDNCTLTDDRDEDMFTEMDSVSASGYMGADAMDEDLDNLTSRSVGGYEDRMSDDGNASLVGFGEGAGSTLSGPIYNRRPLPGHGNAPGPAAAVANWHLERSSSGLSEGATASSNPHHGSTGARRDAPARMMDRETSGADTPVSISAVRERREARMMDGVAVDSAAPATAASSAAATADDDDDHDDDVFVDTTTRGPVPVHPTTTTSSVHNRQQPRYPASASTSTSTREAAERIVRERLDEGESRVGGTTLGSPGGGERLGRFYFEDR